MDYIKQWTFSVCVTLIIAVFFSLLSPRGSMGRFYKTVIALFIIVSFLMPLTDFSINDYIENFNIEDNMVLTEDRYDTSVESTIKKSLNDGGYTGCNVKARTSINGDEISIESVTVTVPKDYISEQVFDYIYNSLGIVADVKTIGD